MPIIPDTKNWTWVLDRPCSECDFTASKIESTDVAALLRANAAAWPAVLVRPEVRARPDDSTWSPLEYAAHVRDVIRVCRFRLELMLDENDPLFPNWDQDATAIAERYGEQDPAVVRAELFEAAAGMADALERITGEQWQRPGRRSDGASFTVETFAKYFLHDLEHHRWDVAG